MIEQTATLMTVGFSALAVVFIAQVASAAVIRFLETVTKD